MQPDLPLMSYVHLKETTMGNIVKAAAVQISPCCTAGKEPSRGSSRRSANSANRECSTPLSPKLSFPTIRISPSYRRRSN